MKNLIAAIPRPLLYLTSALVALFLLALLIGITRPASAPTAPDAVAIPAALPPSTAAAEAIPSPSATPAMPPPSAASSATSDVSTRLADALRPAAFDIESPEGSAMRPEHLKVVKLNSDPRRDESQYVTVLARESATSSQSIIDGPASRAEANVKDTDGVQISKHGYILVDQAGSHDLMLQVVSTYTPPWAECYASIGGASVARAGARGVATSTVSLAAGWHEFELTCSRFTGTWQATFAIRAPGATSPQIQSLSRPSQQQSQQQEAPTSPDSDPVAGETEEHEEVEE